jgi:GT2 family glycosyltransferase
LRIDSQVTNITTRNTSVIIACHTSERMGLLAKSIASALGQVPAPLEVVVAVDNNASLEAELRALYAADRRISIIGNHGSPGASGTRNAGARAARGAALAFLDDDARATQTWLDALVAPLNDPAVTGTGGMVRPAWERDRPSWFPDEFLWTVGASYLGMPTATAPVRNVWSENMAVRAADFRTVGGFREGFGKRANVSRPEDTEFCIRLAAATEGHWLYVPSAEVEHWVPAARSTTRFFLRRCYAEGRGKIEMARLLGGVRLSEESSFAARTIPLGILRRLRAMLRGDAAGLPGTVMMIAGCLWAIAGAARAAKASASPVAEPAGTETPATSPLPAFGPDGTVLRALLAGPLAVGELRVDAAGSGRVAITDDPGDASGVLLTVLVEGSPVGMAAFPPEVLRTGELPAAGRDALDAFLDSLSGAATLPPAARTGVAISVVICTYSRPDDLRRLLKSLDEQDYDDFEVVVVDNNPKDPRTAEVVDSTTLRVPLRLVSAPVRGLSRARNVGVAAASHDWIAMIDDDERAGESWLAELARTITNEAPVDVVTAPMLPAQLRSDAQRLFEAYGGHSKGLGFGRRTFGPRTAGTFNPLLPLPPFGTGGNMTFRRGAIERIGGFHESLGAGTPARGAEDTLALTELLLAGGTIVYEPRAYLWHYHRADMAGLSEQFFGYGTGLTAFYAALVLERPRRIIDLLRIAPSALRALGRGNGGRLADVPDDFPTLLLRRKLRGMLLGPVLLLRGGGRP